MYDSTITVEERLEIQELYARYSVHADVHDGEKWAACYTNDGVFVPSITGAAGRTIAGREALKAFITDPELAEMLTRHWYSNFILKRVGEAVHATCYAMLLDVTEKGKAQIAASVTYSDIIVREDGAWRFKERRPILDGR